MVTTFERSICFGGLFALYSYTVYKFIKVNTTFNKKYHDNLLKKGKKFLTEMNNEDFKMVQTPNNKVIFLFGFQNNNQILKDLNLELIRSVIENFSPNAILHERDLKL
jgi:hypothetical protein